MGYQAKDAANTLFGYLGIVPADIVYVDHTGNRGFLYDTDSGERCVIFIYPISHKADNTKNFFDTRDSGARERGIAWNYAMAHGMKYFCLAVNDQVDKFENYIFSLECSEQRIAEVAGTVNGVRSGSGTQVVIPNDYKPNKKFDRILTKNNFYIAVMKKEFLGDYLDKFDNRPYMIEKDPAEDISDEVKVQYETGYSCEFPRNRILFGAPGTGKSYTLNQEKRILLDDGGDYERVTFHPDYSYANFVGTYKPVPCVDSSGNDAITYEYVPGPFMRLYVKALRNSRTANPEPYLLIIEEINRADVAAVFGDVFQLLDRGDNNVSEYPVRASEDIRKYLSKPENLGGNPEDYAELIIPDNLFIWATMNSADQGVFPMDTAFKRRWDFTYLGIDQSEDKIKGKFVTLGTGTYERSVEWNELRKAINDELSSYRVNEDKLLGPYFLSKKIIPETGEINRERFMDAFAGKVIMYLFDDAAKQKRPSLFEGCKGASENALKYSFICEEFKKKGVFIFSSHISAGFRAGHTVSAEADSE